MCVLYIRPSKSRGYTVIGAVSDSGDKENYTVSDAFFAECPLSRGDIIDGHRLSLIRREDEIFRARKKALSILAYGDNSRRSLYMKLLRSKISKEIAFDTVEEMCALGYINENERLRRIITDQVNLHFVGRAKLYARLLSKGYSKRDIDSVIHELSSEGEIDFSEARRRLVEKYLPPDASEEEIKKLLYKNGHTVC